MDYGVHICVCGLSEPNSCLCEFDIFLGAFTLYQVFWEPVSLLSFLSLPPFLPFPYFFSFLVRIFKFYSLKKFQLHSTVLSTMLTMFYNSSWDLNHFTAESLYPFNNHSLFPAHSSLLQPLYNSFYEFEGFFFLISHTRCHTVLSFCVTYFI